MLFVLIGFVEVVLRKGMGWCCLCGIVDRSRRFSLVVISVLVTLSGVDVVCFVRVKFQG